MPKMVYIFPNWRNFAKSGHAGDGVPCQWSGLIRTILSSRLKFMGYVLFWTLSGVKTQLALM